MGNANKKSARGQGKQIQSAPEAQRVAIQPWKAAVKKLQANTSTLRQDLPEHIDANHMIRSFVAAVRGNDKLAHCSMDSLLDGVATAAQLGLVLTPSLGHAALVPYGGVCQFQPMYQGLMDLAYRTGRVAKIIGRAVYEGDEFDYMQGTTEFIHHRPCGEADPAKLTHAYAVVWIIGSDQPNFVVLNKAQVERARKLSKAKRDDAPWKVHTEAMWIKTAVKRLAKFIPKAPEDRASVMFANAVAYDDLGRRGLDKTPKTIDVEQLEDIEPSDEGVDGDMVDGIDELADRMEQSSLAGTIHDPNGPPADDDGCLV